MFFVLSKVLSFFLQPLNVILLLTFLCFVTNVAMKRSQLPRRLLSWVMLLWLVLGYIPLPALLLQQLEGVHPAVEPDYRQFAGVLVMGGATSDGVVAKARQQVTLSDEAERMTEAVKAFQQNPQLKVLFSGFTSDIFHDGWSADVIAEKFFLEQGVPAAQLLLERKAKNTYENALYSKPLIEAVPGQWALITSASHMPRSVRIFEQVGLAERLLPVPVDYLTGGPIDWAEFDLRKGNQLWTSFIHEWVGTLVYQLTGKL